MSRCILPADIGAPLAPPAPPPPVKPAPSWTLPGPVIFTASDPGQATGKAGVGTVLVIEDRGDGRPDWIPQGTPGRVYQAEGGDQAIAALARLIGDGLTPGATALVSTLGIDPAPFVARGLTTVMVECYLQGQANALDKLDYALDVEGWTDAIPIVGVFDNVGLSQYVPWLRDRGLLASKRWGIYLAEGVTDTGSWATLAGL